MEFKLTLIKTKREVRGFKTHTFRCNPIQILGCVKTGDVRTVKLI